MVIGFGAQIQFQLITKSLQKRVKIGRHLEKLAINWQRISDSLRNLHRESTINTMATITKREIVSALSDQTGLRQSDTSLLVDAFIEMVGKNLEKGHNVTFRTFGTFEICVAKAKIGRNPNKADSEVHIPERCVVRFKPGRDLKTRVAALPQH